MKDQDFAAQRIESIPKNVTIVSEDDFESDEPVKEPSFNLPKVSKPPRPDMKKRPEATKTESLSDLFDNEPDAVRSSGVHESFSTPQEMQEFEIVEAMTFPTANGLEGGVTLQKKRERTGGEKNEDCVLAFEDKDLGAGYGSFDGLGSEGKKGAGALASAKAVEVLPMHLIETYQKLNDTKISEDFEKLSLITLDANLNQAITATPEAYKHLEPAVMKKAIAVSEALKKTNEDVKNTGGKTTACFTLMHTSEDGKRYAITANIGDSGAILRRTDGSVSIITKEDAALPQMIEAGAIPQAELAKMKADPNGYKLGGKFTYNKLKLTNTQALGSSEATPRITITEMQPGDEIYNVTDGILDFFENEEGDTDIESIKNVLNKGGSLKERMESLREVADARSKVAALDEDSSKVSDDSAISAIRYAEAA